MSQDLSIFVLSISRKTQSQPDVQHEPEMTPPQPPSLVASISGAGTNTAPIYGFNCPPPIKRVRRRLTVYPQLGPPLQLPPPRASSPLWTPVSHPRAPIHNRRPYSPLLPPPPPAPRFSRNFRPASSSCCCLCSDAEPDDTPSSSSGPPHRCQRQRRRSTTRSAVHRSRSSVRRVSRSGPPRADHGRAEKARRRDERLRVQQIHELVATSPPFAPFAEFYFKRPSSKTTNSSILRASCNVLEYLARLKGYFAQMEVAKRFIQRLEAREWVSASEGYCSSPGSIKAEDCVKEEPVEFDVEDFSFRPPEEIVETCTGAGQKRDDLEGRMKLIEADFNAVARPAPKKLKLVKLKTPPPTLVKEEPNFVLHPVYMPPEPAELAPPLKIEPVSNEYCSASFEDDYSKLEPDFIVSEEVEDHSKTVMKPAVPASSLACAYPLLNTVSPSEEELQQQLLDCDLEPLFADFCIPELSDACQLLTPAHLDELLQLDVGCW